MRKVEKQAKKISILFIVLLFSMVGITMIFNILVDPYRIFLLGVGSDLRRDNYIGIVPGDGGASNIMKSAGIIKFKPNTVILGTSVIDSGLPVRGNYYLRSNKPTEIENEFSEEYRPIYNAGIRGGGIGEIYEYLRHALLNNPDLKRVIIGLEVGHFDSPGFYNANSLLHKDHLDLKTFFERSLTKSTSKTSLKCSIFGQAWDNISKYFNPVFNGNTSNKKDQFIPIATNPRNLPFIFLINGEERSSELMTAIHTANMNIKITDPEKLEKGFKILEKIVYLIKKNDVELVFFLNPISPYVYSVLERLDKLDEIHKVMSRLSKITPYYDFYKPITFNKDYNKSFHGNATHYGGDVGGKIISILANPNSQEALRYRVTKDNMESVFNDKIKTIIRFTRRNLELKEILYDSNIDYSNYKNSYPTVYNKDYKGYQIIELFGKFYAFPNRKEKFNLKDILQNVNQNVIIAPDLEDIINSLL